MPAPRAAAPSSRGSTAAQIPSVWAVRATGVRDWVQCHPRWSWAYAFLAVWAAIALWRFEIIDSPPYWDAAMGLFLEANFLIETDFDYHRLWFEEKRFVEGGSAVYLTSVLPTLVALLMKALPTPQSVFIVYHLFTFACGAAIALLMVRILLPRVGLLGAALTAAAALTTPLLATQLDLLGMDVPMVACALVAASLVIAGRIGWGALAVLATAAVKMIGAIVGGALVAYLTLATLVRYPTATPRWQRRLWVGLGLSLLTLATMLAVVAWLANQRTSHAETYEVDQERGLSVMADLKYWCPDVLLLTALTLAGTLADLAGRLSQAARRRGGTLRLRLIRETQAFVCDDPLYVFSWCVVLPMAFALSLAYTIPRYLSLPLVFVYLVAGGLVFSRPRFRRVGTGVFVAIVVFNLLNTSGRFFPELPAEAQIDRRTGGILERSREYLADHRANLATVAFLVEHGAGRPVVAGNPFVHFLSLPRLGYVTTPLAGVAVNTFTTNTFRGVDTVIDDPPHNPIFVSLDNRFRLNAIAQIPPPGAGDRLLYDDRFPGSPVEVYEKALPAGTTQVDADRAVLTTLWPAARLHGRGLELAAQGNPERGLALLRRALEIEPARLGTRFELARLLVSLGRYDDAARELQAVIAVAPEDVAPLKLLAELHRAAGRPADAEQQLRAALAIAPGDLHLYELLGQLLLEQNRADEALAAYQQLVQRAPNQPLGYVHQASALVRLGRDGEARQTLAQALALAGEYPEALLPLGDLELRSGHPSAAEDDYIRALIQRPDWPPALNRLAWLLATTSDEKLRDGSRAIHYAERLHATVKEPTAGMFDTLAAAYAAGDRFAEAIAAEEKALELAQRAGDATIANNYRARLQLYRSGRAFFEP